MKRNELTLRSGSSFRNFLSGDLELGAFRRFFVNKQIGPLPLVLLHNWRDYLNAVRGLKIYIPYINSSWQKRVFQPSELKLLFQTRKA